MTTVDDVVIDWKRGSVAVVHGDNSVVRYELFATMDNQNDAHNSAPLPAGNNINNNTKVDITINNAGPDNLGDSTSTMAPSPDITTTTEPKQDNNSNTTNDGISTNRVVYSPATASECVDPVAHWPLVQACRSGLAALSSARAESERTVSEMLSLQDPTGSMQSPGTCRAVEDVRARLRELWMATTEIAGHTLSLVDEPSVCSLVSASLDHIIHRVAIHRQQAAAAAAVELSPESHRRSPRVVPYTKNVYTHYTIKDVQYVGRNASGVGVTSVSVVRSCVDATVAADEHKPTLHIDTFAMPLKAETITTSLGPEAEEENHAIARLVEEVEAVVGLEHDQARIGSHLLRDVHGDWKHTEQRTDQMLAYLTSEIKKTEHHIKLHSRENARRFQQQSRSSSASPTSKNHNNTTTSLGTTIHSTPDRTGENNSSSASLSSQANRVSAVISAAAAAGPSPHMDNDVVLALYTRLEELRAVEDVVVQVTRMKASMLDTVRRNRALMNKNADQKDALLARRDADIGTMHSVVATLRKQLVSVSQALKDARGNIKGIVGGSGSGSGSGSGGGQGNSPATMSARSAGSPHYHQQQNNSNLLGTSMHSATGSSVHGDGKPHNARLISFDVDGDDDDHDAAEDPWGTKKKKNKPTTTSAGGASPSPMTPVRRPFVLPDVPRGPTLTPEREARMLYRLYEGSMKQAQKAAAREAAALERRREDARKLSEEEVEEVNLRLYGKARDHDRQVHAKLEAKYSLQNTLVDGAKKKTRPTTAPLDKEGVARSVDKLFYTAVKDRKATRAELFRKHVVDKEKVYQVKSEDERGEIAMRLYKKST
eukprot:PhM_4_TR9527/c0_g1_i1/m.70786